MSRFRQDRRDFLKLAVAGGAGLATVPLVGTKLDDLVNSEDGVWHRQWWVRNVDEPTTGVDWTKVQRFDERNTCRAGFVKYVGKDRLDSMTALDSEEKKRKIREAVPGYTLRDYALYSSYGNKAPMSFLGPRKSPTPEALGVARWDAKPEENARMIRAALRHFGAATAGFVELNGQTEKLIYAVDPDGKRLEFASVEQPSEDDEKRVIPIKAKWVIVYTVQMSEETLKRAPTFLGAQTTSLTYSTAAEIQGRLQEFLRTLGYSGLGEASTNSLGIAPAFGVMAGLGELSRYNRLLTPEFGPMVRVFKMVTDLPLAPDKPIDAGIVEFCKTCKRCAEVCPSGALSTEKEPYWEVKGAWNNPGHQAWFEDSTLCRGWWMVGANTNCGVCFSACPFAKKDESFVHAMVKSTVGTTSLFNGMFTRLDRAFGYGEQKDLEQWWEEDLPEYGIDTTRATRS